MPLSRLRALILKEFLELRKTPRLFGILIVAPILQLTMLGYAATTDINDVPLVVVDGDRTAASRELVYRFEASRNFTVIDTVTTVAEMEPFLAQGTAWLALAIPAGYGRDVAAGRPVVLQVAADGTDSNSTTAALGYASSLINGYSRELLEGRPAVSPVEAGFNRPAIDPRIRVWFNPQLESRFFMIPGVLALVLLVVTTNVAAMAIVREKEVGTLEQLNVTPLRRWELIAGKLLPAGLIGMLDVLLVTAIAVLWFEVPLRGSMVLLFGLSLLYVLCTLALGLLISTISATQQQAMTTSVFFFLMPMIYLSGFLSPIENMPTVIQWVTYLMPLRYYLVIVRGIFLKGVGMEVLWPQVAALATWGLVVIALAVMRSSKTLK